MTVNDTSCYYCSYSYAFMFLFDCFLVYSINCFNSSCELKTDGVGIEPYVWGTFWCPCLGWPRKVARWRGCPPVYTPPQTLCFLTRSRNQDAPPAHASITWTCKNPIGSSLHTILQKWLLWPRQLWKRQHHFCYRKCLQQVEDYSHVIQTSWLLPKLSPLKGNSAGTGRDQCGRLHLPTKKPPKKVKRKTTNSRVQMMNDQFAKESFSLRSRRLKVLKGTRFFKGHHLTMATCMESLSASLYTATERTPIFLAVRITRHAISPRLAISTFSILPTPEEEDTTDTFQLLTKYRDIPKMYSIK